MNSRLILYSECKLQPEKNFVLDNENNSPVIEDYLATLTNLVIENFQYIKHDKALTIKIDMSQNSLSWWNGSRANYLSIRNQRGDEQTIVYDNPVYYFILNKRWMSKNTLILELRMDTLNTLHWGVNYEVTDKSFIQRMHKPRFVDMSDYTHTFKWMIYTDSSTTEMKVETFTYSNVFFKNLELISMTHRYSFDVSLLLTEISFGLDSTTKEIKAVLEYQSTEAEALPIEVTITAKFRYYQKIVDFKSENISAPLYKKYDNTIYENKGKSKTNWRLYYRNSNSQVDSPIDCFLVPSVPMTIKYSNAKDLSLADFTYHFWKYFTQSYQDGLAIIGFKIGDNLVEIRDRGIIAISKNSTGNKFIAYYINDGIYQNLGEVNAISFITENDNIYSTGNMTSTTPDVPYTLEVFEEYDLYNKEEASPLKVFSYPKLDSNIISSSIDKTLSTNIKVIDIPYAPNTFSIYDDKIYISSPWAYTNNMIKLDSLESPFDNIIEANEENILAQFLLPVSQNQDLSSRVYDDPKLLHSDFYRCKFVYDSFSKDFHMELLDVDEMMENDNGEAFKFEFIPSRNVVSKFLFKFIQLKYKISLEDYEDILAVARNNEEVLYNSSYINYIRNGYNYDVKAKQRNELMAGIGLAGSSLGTIGSMIANPSSIPMGAVSLFSSLMGYATTKAQGEENMQRKLQESKAQAVSVANADDIDLLFAYSDNKAKICKYEISDEMKRVVSDIFHYCGYVINEQMIPNINNRTNFNYVQGDLVINEKLNTPYDLIDDIKEKFTEGVTFLHSNGNDMRTLDFNQTKENIERF